jgi:hypothetical protein
MNAPNAVQLSDVPSLLAQLGREKFYGRLSFDLRNGELVLIRTEKTQLVCPNKPHQGVNRDVEHAEHLR